MTRIVTRAWWPSAVFLVALASGCGTEPSAADPAKGQTVLHSVLDAWKAGETPADLARRATPIQVNDVDWSQGFRLVSYKGAQEGRPVGFDMSYNVVLELKGPKGKTVTKTAVYVVTTDPQVLVLRQEG